MMSLVAFLRSRKGIIAVVVVAIILTASVGIVVNRIQSSEGPAPSAMPTSDRQVVRLGDPINFSAAGSTGDIEYYLWEFGDGNTSTERETSHTYEFSGPYNVTLTVIDGDGRSDNCSLPVGVQLQDFDIVRTAGRDRELRPSWMTGRGVYAPVGPNIGSPEVDIRLQVSRPVGQFQVEVEVRIEQDGGFRYEPLVSETRSSAGSDIDVTFSLGPGDFPSEICHCPSEINVIFWIDEGRYSSIVLTMVGTFPVELLL